jgi:hypothetical protein
MHRLCGPRYAPTACCIQSTLPRLRGAATVHPSHQGALPVYLTTQPPHKTLSSSLQPHAHHDPIAFGYLPHVRSHVLIGDWCIASMAGTRAKRARTAPTDRPQPHAANSTPL